MSSRQRTDTKPWYRQFWARFLLALPGSVVIAGMSMVFIAFKGADTLVSDNYYRDGLAINQVLEQDQRAASLSLSAELHFDLESGELFIDLIGIEAPMMTLLFLHPTDESRDQSVTLKQVRSGFYRSDLAFHPSHRYYLRLLPEPDRKWRLNGEIDFANTQKVILGTQ